MPDRKKSFPAKTIFLLVLLALAAISVFLFFKINQKADKKTAISPEQERQLLQEKLQTLDKDAAAPEGETPAAQPETPAILAGSAGEPGRQAPGEAVATDPCKQAIDTIDAFFTRLDSEEYIAELQLAGGSKAYFTAIINKVLINKPSIARETDDLLAILQNTAHFYRVLGEQDIIMLKKIMANEKGFYEPVMAAFFKVMTNRDECQHINFPIQLSMEDMYTYSAFFLNTLGGQAYLFRREPVLRVLVKYYCVLALDQANMKNANPLGLDIRYPLNSLVEEVTATTGLQNRDGYLNNLLQLQDKYDKLYGN